MIVKLRNKSVITYLPIELINSIENEVTSALNAVKTQEDLFVVNDTVYWADTGNPAVMNQATYISSIFQNKLVDSGWTKEKSLEGQKIDAYKLFDSNHKSYSLNHNLFFQYMEKKAEDLPEGNLGLECFRLFEMYVKRSCFSIDSFDSSLGIFTKNENEDHQLKVGLEFETGNIASSFRALMKLQLLFQTGTIDIGVFITSVDKANAATRIWPTTNRNGSFEELERRHYGKCFNFPLLEFSFKPDSFSSEAKFLKDDGTLYSCAKMEETKEIKGKTYTKYTRPFGPPSEVYLPVNEAE